MEENTIVIRDPKTFEFEFIIKSIGSLVDHKIKNEIEQLLSKHSHENNIHEYRKQQNE